MLIIKIPKPMCPSGTHLNVKYSNYPPLANKSFINSVDINDLYMQKQEIDNLYKTKKGEKTWKYASRLLNEYELIPDKYNSISSRAFFKLKEILAVFNIISGSSYVSAHICEAPGGFIEATEHECKEKNINLRWVTQSMVSKNKNIPKINNNLKNKYSGQIIQHLNSDITNNQVTSHFINTCFSLFPEGLDLVTGDGGFDVSDNFNIQEQKSFILIFIETLISLKILKKGGTMIIKIFDIFTVPTYQLIYFISSVFGETWIYKPKMSRPANGEKYIIAKNYEGFSKVQWNNDLFKIKGKYISSLFDCSVPQQSAHASIIKFNNKYIKIQLNFIKNVLKFIKEQNYNDKKKYKELQLLCADSYCKLLNII